LYNKQTDAFAQLLGDLSISKMRLNHEEDDEILQNTIQYAFLTTYQVTYAIRKDGKQLAVSEKISPQNFLAAIYFIMCLQTGFIVEEG